MDNSINNIEKTLAYLTGALGMGKKDIMILNEIREDPLNHPTRLRIVNALQWLAKDAKAGDSLLLHYSVKPSRTRLT